MTDNTIHGDADGTVVQAGVVHGGIHLGAPESVVVVPRQLPLATRGFVNRSVQIALLDALVRQEGEGGNEAPRGSAISAIAGTPGVGKTALAVSWAHTARSHFTGGDLYIDMRGYGPGPRVEAAQALDSLLRCLDVAPERIPADLGGRAALYRSLLAGRRVLVLIDNAASADQVRPLLPASPGCLVIVTSRSSLAGLVTREGARRMVLDILSPEESLALLRHVAGADRIDADVNAALRLARHCAFLPLALRITAERLTARPGRSLARFAAELDDQRRRLDALRTEDDELSDVRAVFAASYRDLDPDAARLFRRLGLHPGPEAGVHACAALAEVDVPTAGRLLDRLVRVHLVTETTADRYRLHDLLRLYAAERAELDEEPHDRERALRAVLVWYLGTVDGGHRVILPAFHRVPLPQNEGTWCPLGFAGVDEAMDWFETERENLVAAVRTALDNGFHDLAWRLPAVMYGFFEMRGHWTQWRDVHLLGVTAAEAVGDQHGLACNRLGLGDVNWLLTRTEEALGDYRAAAEGGARSGDRWVEGFALRQTAVLLHERGDHAEAAHIAQRALDVFASGGERRGAGMALLTLGDCRLALSDTGGAVAGYARAVGLFREVGDAWSVAWGGCAMARALAADQRWGEVLDHLAHSLSAFRSFGDRRNEARALIGTAEACAGLGRTDEARGHLRAAVELLDDLGDEQGADLRERAEALDADVR
ncbi:ATP-binding protein [Nocardiopsis ansamitocini]|uniref:AAA+ ATPase domain-containing protein n=1 Tax=Nocardiopsis ansamitocini TaxID=1670832 RepID=A0A9W6UHE1_9ACTN|nr:tetratricopeptide repeat protein [Nocardiopsis ansamitocini]GLU46534.1 hypothetical protein Nans01_08850 [Nocardiopsis ansamitocini]